MKNQFFMLLFALILFSCQEKHSMTDKEYDKEIAEHQRKADEQNAFLKRTLGNISVLETKNGCNKIVVYLLADSCSKNIDSLEKSAELLTDSYYTSVLAHQQDCGAMKPRAAVFLYSSSKNYKLTRPFASYNVSSGRQMTTNFFEDNLK